jgi:hypothetical protein
MLEGVTLGCFLGGVSNSSLTLRFGTQGKVPPREELVGLEREGDDLEITERPSSSAPTYALEEDPSAHTATGASAVVASLGEGRYARCSRACNGACGPSRPINVPIRLGSSAAAQ